MRRSAAVVVSVLLLSACSDQDAAPATDDPPVAIDGVDVLAEDPSHDHVEGQLEYDRLPPLGGPHNPRWLSCDVYDEPVPVELAVHSLEHGAVWLAHAPGLPEQEAAALAGLAELAEQYVLVAPQEGLETEVVAVAWGAALEASSAQDPRLARFVEAYAGGGQGGEPGAPCRDGGASPTEARALLEDA